MLESLRLWPTTPLILRESVVDGSTYAIFAPFSGGPGVCPGRNLVLRVAAAVLEALPEVVRELR